MSVLELQDALSWDDRSENFSEAKKPFRGAVVGLCSPLVEHLEVNDTLRLVHLSVRDFLCGNCQDSRYDKTLIRLEEAHCKVVEVCIEYLCQPDVASVLDVNKDQLSFRGLRKLTLVPTSRSISERSASLQKGVAADVGMQGTSHLDQTLHAAKTINFPTSGVGGTS